MTNFARFGWFMAICGRIYGQKWPDLWPNKIAGMAMAMVAIPDFTSMIRMNFSMKILRLSAWFRASSLSEVSRRYLRENRLYAFLGIPTIACQNGIRCYSLILTFVCRYHIHVYNCYIVLLISPWSKDKQTRARKGGVTTRIVFIDQI